MRLSSRHMLIFLTVRGPSLSARYSPLFPAVYRWRGTSLVHRGGAKSRSAGEQAPAWPDRRVRPRRSGPDRHRRPARSAPPTRNARCRPLATAPGTILATFDGVVQQATTSGPGRSLRRCRRSTCEPTSRPSRRNRLRSPETDAVNRHAPRCSIEQWQPRSRRSLVERCRKRDPLRHACSASARTRSGDVDRTDRPTLRPEPRIRRARGRAVRHHRPRPNARRRRGGNYRRGRVEPLSPRHRAAGLGCTLRAREGVSGSDGRVDGPARPRPPARRRTRRMREPRVGALPLQRHGRDPEWPFGVTNQRSRRMPRWAGGTSARCPGGVARP